MEDFIVTMYAPDIDKFQIKVRADSKKEAEEIALRRIIVINVEEVENEH